MSQPMIDLLPDEIRARSLAGVIVWRYVLAGVVVVGSLTARGYHAHHLRVSAIERLVQAEANGCKEKAKELDAEIVDLDEQIATMKVNQQKYASVALPVPVSRILASAVNRIPESVALDRIRVEVQNDRGGARRDTKTPAAAKRVLKITMHGVAPDGTAVTAFTRRLRAMGTIDGQSGLSPICRTVRTEYERPRKTPILGLGDLEFSINLVIPLDRHYWLRGDEIVEVAP